MSSISPEVTTLCLIAIGVGVLIMFAGFLVIRVIKGSFFGLGMMAMRMLSEPKEEEANVKRFATPHAEAQDLRARAQSLDFDATVAKYRNDEPEDAPPSNTPPSPYQGYPPPPSPPRQDNDPYHRQ